MAYSMEHNKQIVYLHSIVVKNELSSCLLFTILSWPKWIEFLNFFPNQAGAAQLAVGYLLCLVKIQEPLT
jgi:hypothetical protein